MAEQPPQNVDASDPLNPAEGDSTSPISQADLDLIEKAMAGADATAAELAADVSKVTGEGAADELPSSQSIDDLLKQANFEDASNVAAEAPGAEAEIFKLPNFQQVMADAQVSSIDLLRDVELNVKIELGRSRMLVEDVLKLAEGSVVELDKLAGDPVDVFVNDRLVARGEVLVLNDNFCVRVNEIVAGVKEEGL
jgi:flagellar motor switch protein FliN/FliY